MRRPYGGFASRSRRGGAIAHPDVNLQWVAFLFAVLTGSLTCMPSATAEALGLGRGRAGARATLSRCWFRAVTTCLPPRGRPLLDPRRPGHPSPPLTVSAHVLGASACTTGLTADAPGAEVDRLTYLINPLYSRSELPRNRHDDDDDDGDVNGVSLPDSVPTVTGYSRFFLHSVANIMPRLQDGLMTATTPFTRYEQAMKWDRQLRTLSTAGRPAWLASNAALDTRAGPSFYTGRSFLSASFGVVWEGSSTYTSGVTAAFFFFFFLFFFCCFWEKEACRRRARRGYLSGPKAHADLQRRRIREVVLFGFWNPESVPGAACSRVLVSVLAIDGGGRLLRQHRRVQRGEL
ncbi:hypothetical protein F4778DRAFT_781011 [Xylariomycetidae sp. FL2044]|nr:hypothetical protein F4778DRAFT_781011 [Xylariomycetidae sp. FL2044]